MRLRVALRVLRKKRARRVTHLRAVEKLTGLPWRSFAWDVYGSGWEAWEEKVPAPQPIPASWHRATLV